MPAWEVKTYRGCLPPVQESPLEKKRLRVFSRRVGQSVDSFIEDLAKAITSAIVLQEEHERKKEILDKFLWDYEHYSGYPQEHAGILYVVLERVDDGFEIVDI
jgi:hypothetical protein